jgi:hypothetical protein
MPPAGGTRTVLASLALAAALAHASPASAAPAAREPGVAPTGPPAPAPAPARGRYTGTWRLDVPASDFGKRGRVPVSREDRIHEDSLWVSVRSLSVRGGGDTLLLEYRYRTDGEAVNRLRGQEIRTRGRRESGTLWFDSEAEFFVVKLEVKEHWSLSADGTALTQERTSKSPLGEERQRLLFRRLP